MKMTDKEQLEYIKNRYKEDMYDCKLGRFDIKWLIEQAEKSLWLDGKLIVVEENLNHTAYFLEQEKRKVKELEDLINTHAPHGRNYTNEQYVNLRNQISESNEAHHLKDMEHEGLVQQLKEKDQLIQKYVNAYSRIEQIYRANYEQRPNEYDGGYLDGLDTALGILEEVEE